MLDSPSSVLTHAIALAVGAVVGIGVLALLFAAEARRVLHDEPPGEIPEVETVQATATIVAPEPTEADDDVAARQLRMLHDLEEAERLRNPGGSPPGAFRRLTVEEWATQYRGSKNDPPFVELAQPRQAWPPRLGDRNPYDRLVETIDASRGVPAARPDVRVSVHTVADLLVVLLTQLEIHGKRHGYGQTAANMVKLRERAEALRAELSPAAAQEPTL